MIHESSIAQIRIAKIGYIMISILFSALGIFLIVYPSVSAFFIFYFIGILLIIFGIIRVIGYISKDLYRLAFQYDLAFGILFFTLGFIICIFPQKTLSTFYTVIGILILADGLFRIQLSGDAKAFGIRSWWLILFLAIITTILGVLLILYPAKGAEVLVTLLGISLLSEGVLTLGVAINTVKISKVINETIEEIHP